jgi:hypothetical protein
MNPPIALGSTVRRIEPPTNGLARVTGVVSGLHQVDYELEYAEDGSGWWPASSIELVNPQDL